MTITILIADDHPIVRKGLSQFFREETDFQVIAECADGESALRLIADSTPEVALVDLHMPGIDGLEVLRRMAHVSPSTKGILLAGNIDQAAAQDAMAAGAKGMVLKETASSLLLQCVRQVQNGGFWIDPAAGGGVRLSTRVQDSRRDQRLDALTTRETELVRLVTEGLTNRTIAARLEIAEGTVKSHLHSVSEKLGIGGRMQIANFMLRQDHS